MSAEDGENAMQDEAVDQEEELAIGVQKLKVVGLSTTFCPLCCVPARVVILRVYNYRKWAFKKGSC